MEDTEAGGASELMMMLLADARLPTGAHTQSAGLEPALNGGMSKDVVPLYIRARLGSVTAVEAGSAVVARHRCLTLPSSRLVEGLAEVHHAWLARTVSPALRETSILLGRGYLRLAGRLWAESPLVRALLAVSRVELPCRAVVLGVVAAETGLTAAQLVRLIGYDEAQTIAAAALKLTAMDPVDASKWVLASRQDITELVKQTASITETGTIPAFAAPQIEQWAEIHSNTTMRLFRA